MMVALKKSSENSTWQMENLRESTHGASCVRRKAGRGREEMLDVRHCEQASRSVLSIISPLNYFKKYQNLYAHQSSLNFGCLFMSIPAVE